MYRDDEAAQAAARTELVATYRAAMAALPAGAREAIAARSARVMAGTIGLVAGAAIIVMDAVLSFGGAVAVARVHVWVRGTLIGAWAAIAIGYALAHVIAAARYTRALAAPLRSTGDALDDLDALTTADPIERVRRAAKAAQAIEYRSLALPLAALVVLLPPSIYYAIGVAYPDVLAVHALSVPGRITRGDVLYLLLLRHLLWPFAIVCFGAGRAVREVAEPRRNDALRMHPLNVGLMSIYGLLVVEVALFADRTTLRADWFACMGVLAALWWVLPSAFRRVRAERAVLAVVAGDRVGAPPRWLRWLKAAAVLAPFVAIAALFLQVASTTGEITCDDALACKLVESTFATRATYRFALAPGDRIELESHALSRGGKEHRLVRRGTPLGSQFFRDASGVRAAADELTHAAATARPPQAPLRFGGRWRGVLAALLVLGGALVAALAVFRGQE